MADLNKYMAREFVNTDSYALDELVIYEQILYKCINSSYVAGDFNALDWEPVYLTDLTHADSIINANIAPLYSNSSTYLAGEIVLYNNKLYICLQPVTIPEDFVADKWLQTTVAEIFNGEVAPTILIDENVAEPYDSTSTYEVGDVVSYDGKLYCCISTISAPQSFTINNWYKTTLFEMFG